MALPTQFSQPGPINVRVPSWDQTANLIIDYSRNEKDFVLNQYTHYMTVEHVQDFYPRFLASDVVRVPYADGRNWLHPDGQPRPTETNQYNGTRFSWIQYQLSRYLYPDTLGYITKEQAVWDVQQQKLGDLAAKAMTQRTVIVLNLLETTSNFQSSHVQTATAWGTAGGNTGGFWQSGTITNPYIMYTLDAVANQIALDTNSKVTRDKLKLIINPVLANTIKQTPEIHNFLAQQSNSLPVLTGEKPSQKETWGLPSPLYGYDICVEYANKVATLEDTTPYSDTSTFCLDSNTAIVVARPGSIDSTTGGSNFSTIHMLFMKGWEMVTEIWDDVRNKLYDISVWDFYTPLIPSPESGALITNCTM